MAQDVTRLKELLFDSESRTLNDLNRRMDIVFERAGTNERFTTSVAEVLDDALRKAEIDRHTEVSRAIAPLIVKTIKTEIRGSQDELAEALYPAMGRMVRAYIASAIKDLMDDVNRRFESNPFMLRVRSVLSGRPVAELAFAEGQRLKVEELYLIRRGSGELVGHWPIGPGISAQDQRVSGILAAINDVSNEAFKAEQDTLRRVDLGGAFVIMRASPTYLLAAKCKGAVPASVEQVLDEHFLSTIERLRALANGDANAHVPERAAFNLLGDLSGSLEDAMAEQHAKLSHDRRGISPSGVLIGAIALLLFAWGSWVGYASYATERVRTTAEAVLAKQPELQGYPVTIDVKRRGGEVTLGGLVPTTDARDKAMSGLTKALPLSTVVDETAALGIKEAKADIKALRVAQTELGVQTVEADTRIQKDQQTDVAALRAEIKALTAEIAKANAKTQTGIEELRTALTTAESQRQSDLKMLREEIARAVAPTPRERLEALIRQHAIFFSKDTDYQTPEATAALLDEAAQIMKDANVLVRVVGFTDERGGKERNTPLSKARANKIVDELTRRGVSADRLVAVGRNDIEDLSPVVGAGSPNRRVEFEIGFDGERAR